MTDAVPVLIPLVNPNEPDSRLVETYVADGDNVRDGQALAMVETTKSTLEINAPQAGFIVDLWAQPGASLRAGERLCWVAEDAGWRAHETETSSKSEAVGDRPEGLRISAPALALAQANELDITALPIGPFLTENEIRQWIAREHAADLRLPDEAPQEGRLLIYGGGRHARAVIDLVRAVGDFEIAGIIDDGVEKGADVMGVEVLGGAEALPAMLEDGFTLVSNAVGGIANMRVRIEVFQRVLAAGFDFPTLIHPTTFVEPNAVVAPGVQVFPQAYIGTEASVGFGAIVNTAAVVSHDCLLAPYVNISPGALLAGGVEVGEGTLIGMGVTINLNVQIGAEARIGNSAVIKNDVPAGAIIRAGAVWPEPE